MMPAKRNVIIIRILFFTQSPISSFLKQAFQRTMQTDYAENTCVAVQKDVLLFVDPD